MEEFCNANPGDLECKVFDVSGLGGGALGVQHSSSKCEGVCCGQLEHEQRASKNSLTHPPLCTPPCRIFTCRSK